MERFNRSDVRMWISRNANGSVMTGDAPWDLTLDPWEPYAPNECALCEAVAEYLTEDLEAMCERCASETQSEIRIVL